MYEGISEGQNTCIKCGKVFYATHQKFPDNDIRHPIGCPYCDNTVGYVSGTDEFETITIETFYERQKKLANTPICPRCGSIMKLRTNNTGKQFYGCANYPNCRGTRNYED